MKVFLTILLIFFISFFQVTFSPKIALFSSLPNFILIFAILDVFQKDFKKAILWALLGGFLLDIFSSNPFLNMISLFLIVFLAHSIFLRYFERENFYLFLSYCFLASLLNDFLLFVLSYFSRFKMSFDPKILLLNGLYTTFFGIFLYFIYANLIKPHKKEFTFEGKIK